MGELVFKYLGIVQVIWKPGPILISEWLDNMNYQA